MISVDWNPSRQTLRTFAIGLCVLATAYSGWLWWGDRLVGYRAVLAAVAGILGIVGVISPNLLRWIYVIWMVLAFPVGWMVFQVSLVVLYFGVFTPFGWIMRLGGRDPLDLKFDSAAESYWHPYRGSKDPRRHFRQY